MKDIKKAIILPTIVAASLGAQAQTRSMMKVWLRPLLASPRVITRLRVFTSMLPPETRHTVLSPSTGSLPKVKTLRPDVKVYGVQSSGAPSMAASLKEGKLCHLNDVSTIADGICVKEPGEQGTHRLHSLWWPQLWRLALRREGR